MSGRLKILNRDVYTKDTKGFFGQDHGRIEFEWPIADHPPTYIKLSGTGLHETYHYKVCPIFDPIKKCWTGAFFLDDPTERSTSVGQKWPGLKLLHTDKKSLKFSYIQRDGTEVDAEFTPFDLRSYKTKGVQEKKKQDGPSRSNSTADPSRSLVSQHPSPAVAASTMDHVTQNFHQMNLQVQDVREQTVELRRDLENLTAEFRVQVKRIDHLDKIVDATPKETAQVLAAFAHQLYADVSQRVHSLTSMGYHAVNDILSELVDDGDHPPLSRIQSLLNQLAERNLIRQPAPDVSYYVLTMDGLSEHGHLIQADVLQVLREKLVEYEAREAAELAAWVAQQQYHGVAVAQDQLQATAAQQQYHAAALAAQIQAAAAAQQFQAMAVAQHHLQAAAVAEQLTATAQQQYYVAAAQQSQAATPQHYTVTSPITPPAATTRARIAQQVAFDNLPAIPSVQLIEGLSENGHDAASTASGSPDSYDADFDMLDELMDLPEPIEDYFSCNTPTAQPA